MALLAAACIFFVGLHVLVSGTRLRDGLVARLGEKAYRGLFSLLSAVGLAAMIWGFVRARVPVPTELMQWRWLAMLLVFVAFQFIVLGLLTPSPTAVGGEKTLDSAEPAQGILRVTRHPFLWGMALWAAVHAAFNPQPAPLWFFGTFLALALVGPPSIDAKRARALGQRWSRYAQVTSNIPFAAIAAGRNRMAWSELSGGKLAIGAAAFLGFLLLHRVLFGVAAY